MPVNGTAGIVGFASGDQMQGYVLAATDGETVGLGYNPFP
jgi:hypothetical protein